MIIRANDEKVRYTGRWNVKGEVATSTAPGNYFEFGFVGDTAVMAFITIDSAEPLAHIYVSVDGGAMVSMPINSYHRITAEENGRHHVKVLIKSTMEKGCDRWYNINSKVSFAGVTADDFYTLEEDNRPKIEFIGDSITEGIAIDVLDGTYFAENAFPLHAADSTADYSYLTAKMLDFRPYNMGYGRLGVLREGNGNVPPVSSSYGFYSHGEPMESINADYIVINHGANDASFDDAEFVKAYTDFLDLVRSRNKKSVIIALTPFGGYKGEQIGEAVRLHNEKSGDNVYYLDARDWIPREPLHPLRSGHCEIARRLSAWIRETFLK
jgi:hypothetical protein